MLRYLLTHLQWSLCFFVLTFAFTQGLVADDVSLYGRWALDIEKSDNVANALEEFSRHNKPKRNRSDDDEKGKRSATLNTGISPGRKGGVSSLVEEYLPGKKILLIEKVTNGIRVQYEGLDGRLIDTTGKTGSISATGKPFDDNRNVAIAGWESGKLYSEITTEQGIRIFESYSVSGSILVIETEFRYPTLDPWLVKRVFNRASKK